jgi:hypothetical protein
METDTTVFYARFSTLTFGATDTTSTIIARIIYLLAQHPDVQDRVRNEVREARANGDLDYNQISALPYLDAIVRESLRLWILIFFFIWDLFYLSKMFLSYPPVLNVAREWASTILRLNFVDSPCWLHLGLRGTQLSPSQNRSSAMMVLMSTRLSFPKAQIFSSPFIRQTESWISGDRMLMSGNQKGGYLRSLIASPKLGFQECIHTCQCHATCSFSFPDSFIRMTFLAGGHSCMWVMVSQEFSINSLKQ